MRPTDDQLDRLASRSRREARAERQAPLRRRQARARRRAAELVGAVGSPRRVAGGLRVSGRTLRRWKRLQRDGVLTPTPLGRPCAESSPPCRLAALREIAAQGAHVGLPTLRDRLPEVPRAELIDLQRDFRCLHRATCRRGSQRLTWTRPGAVWAMDHKQPPRPVDGRDRAVLAVRDLASGMQLAWLPAPDATAAPVRRSLATLFQRHGAPLVVKSDNGSAFVGEAIRDLLDRHRVVPLRSPPATPQYNGGCEAAIGAMAVRTEHRARLAGRPGLWRDEDLDAALEQANHVHRTRERPDRSAADVFAERAPVTETLREQFLEALAQRRALAGAEDAHGKREKARNERHAIAQVLVDLGLLTVTWRSVPLPLRQKKVANIP